ncbi:hypothetical protein [Salarchaeum sp. JOR-1]|uniref:hypothetical protein n=1 Tax=Salarchaeum sp. JOR-1 TaxID=2599399 RepID=UPI0011988247|nr:hypothetical protein [Salarchaeum sp. JOR-1]QDX39753.1 hypothetical protein FQU85_02140 [Salarchaeum sp. JOR-1]
MSVVLVTAFMWVFSPADPVVLAVLMGVAMVPAHYDGLRHAERFDFSSFTNNRGALGLAGWLAVAFAGGTGVAVVLSVFASRLLAAAAPATRFTAVLVCAIFPPVFLGYRLVVRLNPDYRSP